jgi:hypothetical protein
MDCMKSGTSKWLAAPHEKKAWTKNAWIDYVLWNFTFFYFSLMELCIFCTRLESLQNAFGASFWSSNKSHLHGFALLLLHGNQKKGGERKMQFSCFFSFFFFLSCFLVVTSHHIVKNILKKKKILPQIPVFFIKKNSPKNKFLN